jgi:hypothetical protein
LLRFPGGLHDDIVDGMAWLTKLVMNHAPPPKPVTVVQFESWKDKLSEFVEDSRKKHWMAA